MAPGPRLAQVWYGIAVTMTGVPVDGGRVVGLVEVRVERADDGREAKPDAVLARLFDDGCRRLQSQLLDQDAVGQIRLLDAVHEWSAFDRHAAADGVDALVGATRRGVIGRVSRTVAPSSHATRR